MYYYYSSLYVFMSVHLSGAVALQLNTSLELDSAHSFTHFGLSSRLELALASTVERCFACFALFGLF